MKEKRKCMEEGGTQVGETREKGKPLEGGGNIDKSLFH